MSGIVLGGFAGPPVHLCLSMSACLTAESSSRPRLPAGWTHKRCPTCKFIGSREDFGTQSQCRRCRSEHERANKETIRVKRRERYHRDPKGAVAKSLAYKRQHPELYKDYGRKSKYGLQPGEYARMLAAQDGLCLICRTPHPKPLHVDHCHVTNKVRGLLCDLCNRGLGYFHDDPEQLESAARYLRGFQ
jgi:hypothetical protein